jgi:transcriptional regulator with XRE-family HTH domain
VTTPTPPQGREPGDDPAGQGFESGPRVPRGAVSLQVGANIAGLRRALRLTPTELAERAAVSRSAIIHAEEGRTVPAVVHALKIAGALETPIEGLTAGVFWNPGEMGTPGAPEPRRFRRADGYFSTEPERVRDLSVGPPVDVSGDRGLAASIIGANLRDARRRRHLPQHGLGVKQAHVSRIERGVVEPALDTLVGLARELEMPIASLMAGMRWADVDPGAVGSRAGTGGRRRDPRSLDGVIARRCREGESVPGMANELLVGESTVRHVIARLRREGRNLGPYGVAAGKEFLLTLADTADETRLDREAWAAAWQPVGSDAVRKRIGESIRTLRRRSRFTQQVLAEACALPTAGISRYERQGLNASLTYLIRLAASLRVPCSSLTPGIRWDAGSGTFLLGPDTVSTTDTPAVSIMLGLGPESSPATPAVWVGHNARQIRQAAGLSEATIAHRVGKSARYFNAVERGTKAPRPITVLMLAAALDVDLDALLAGICDWYVRALPPIDIPEAEKAAVRAGQQARVLRLWGEGEDLQSIGTAVDLSPGTVFGVVERLREIGVDVPYRRAPVDATQLATRLRRRRRGGQNGVRPAGLPTPVPIVGRQVGAGGSLPDLRPEKTSPRAPSSRPTGRV